MSAPFVSQLRTTKEPVKLAEPGPGTIALRVECVEVWDTVRVIARPEQAVSEVKSRVLARVYPADVRAEEFVLKFRGWEILDERASLKDAGLLDGSIILLAYRRRRAVR